ELEQYGNSDYFPLHMPGHKRNPNLFHKKSLNHMYGMDITEIQGFDDLHSPEGILLQAMEEAARIYHAKASYFLVNGSTSGILSAISAVAKMGEHIIVARNSHKAVYHSIFLRNLLVSYVYPSYIEEYDMNGSVNPNDVARLLEDNPHTKGVVITSPTMQGVVSDIATIAMICHKRGVPLIVDEAHGAHFGLEEEGLSNSNENGADLVIQSLHKTLPALTQTAILHYNSIIVAKREVERYLAIYQTSSPSYLLMGSIIRCNHLVQLEAKSRMQQLRTYAGMLEEVGTKLHCMQVVQRVQAIEANCFEYDIGKIILSVKNTSWTGKQLYDILLEDYHLQMELFAESYVLGILTGYDTQEGIHRLVEALYQIDKQIQSNNRQVQQWNKGERRQEQSYLLTTPVPIKMTSYETSLYDKQIVPIREASGGISGEYIYCYPPGIPILVPGEVITRERIDWILLCLVQGMNLQGLANKEIGTISIIDDK
ncbi:MAG: aminotransferase class I/II-fold pyridoxal phosphate-dependent enzyme, partial [Eubacteriales bacterium]